MVSFVCFASENISDQFMLTTVRDKSHSFIFIHIVLLTIRCSFFVELTLTLRIQVRRSKRNQRHSSMRNGTSSLKIIRSK
jgi:hypothetical protein